MGLRVWGLGLGFYSASGFLGVLGLCREDTMYGYVREHITYIEGLYGNIIPNTGESNGLGL